MDVHMKENITKEKKMEKDFSDLKMDAPTMEKS